MITFNVVAAIAAATCAGVVSAQNASLPVVDLGYELHQASFYNVNLSTHRLKNIQLTRDRLPVASITYCPTHYETQLTRSSIDQCLVHQHSLCRSSSRRVAFRRTSGRLAIMHCAHGIG